MKMLSKKDKEFLLNLAKNAITAYVNKNKVTLPKNINVKLKKKRAVFVSLYVNNELRGCIGSLLAKNELYKDVIKNAISAAFHDLRFPAISKDDLKSLKIEVSILTDPVKLNVIDHKHLLKKLDSKEGIIIKKGQRTATFLPQVWKQIKENKEFLMNLCFKAGLNVEDWKHSNTEVYAYKVEKFTT